MSDIMGSITTIKSFFSNDEVKIECFNNEGKPKVIFELEKDRRYIIPRYQREIRWKGENIIELMEDVNNGPKFLGNIILSKTDDGYSIIDGQQRITSLLLLFQYIRSQFGDQVDVIATCKLIIESFLGFETLFNSYFNIDTNTEEELEKTDDYNQMKRYTLLWKDIDQSGIIRNKYDARRFLKNMEKCEINIIISKSSDYAVDYFLDVNLKGIKLDTEDIFKGYLFSQNKEEEIYKSWVALKKLSEILEKKNAKYPLMKIIEHYFYCDLYNHDEYKNILFDEEFLLKDKYDLEGSSFYKGQHLLKVIGDNKYLLNSINNIAIVLGYITKIITDGYGDSFKTFFNTQSNIDDIEKQIFYSIIKYIILDQNKVPKVLIMKYMLDICKNKDGATKSDYKKIYIAYVTAVCFNIFEGKKNGDIIYNIVKNKNWDFVASEKLKEYFKEQNYADRKFEFICKYSPNSKSADVQNFRCRSLACIYNYFLLKDNVRIIKGKTSDVKAFLNNNTLYSLEHFVINNSGKCKITINDKEFEYTYPEDIIKYTNSITNYIFIPEEINKSLENKYIVEKIRVLQSCYKSSIICEYSNMIINLVNETFKFPSIEECGEFDSVKDKLDAYYLTKFRNEYMDFLTKVIEKVYKSKF